MCWIGKLGAEGNEMNTEEIISNMARLSLTGKLSLAISECTPWWNLVPYYDMDRGIKKEDFMRQINVLSVGDQHEILQERVLSILLKSIEEVH